MRCENRTLAHQSVHKHIILGIHTYMQSSAPVPPPPRRDWVAIAVAGLPGLAAVVALIFAALSVRATDDQLKIAAQGQITDRYNAAVTNLGSSSIDVRLGGIYALQRLMQDSPRDQPTVVAILCAFVRDRAPLIARQAFPPPPPPTDIQAALTVVGTRNTANDGHTTLIDLNHAQLAAAQLIHTSFRGANLFGANLFDAHLRGANLSRANLENGNVTDADLRGANLTSAEALGADLSGADLIRADLDLADLGGAHLDGAILWDAHLGGAELGGAYLEGAMFYHADLVRADFYGAYAVHVGLVGANLTGADLERANLTGADLEHANLTGARLYRANLTGANLKSVKGLRASSSAP